MSKERILVVEDEPQYQRLIQFNLESEGYCVTCVGTGEEGLAALSQNATDLIILDILLPGQDGFKVCSRVREVSTLPIIMLTALGSEEDKVKGLRLGADDYLVKPFSAQELLARVLAVIRRSQFSEMPTGDPIVKIGDLVVDLFKHCVAVRGKDVHLTPTEYRLLSYLVSHPGRAVTQEDCLEAVWGQSYRGDHEVLRVTMWRLRQKLHDDPQSPSYFTTIPGVGYLVNSPN